MQAQEIDQRVQGLMSTDVVSVDALDTVHAALELMVENRVSALPVVDGGWHCIGILSVTDIVSLARDLFGILRSISIRVTYQWTVWAVITARCYFPASQVAT